MKKQILNITLALCGFVLINSCVKDKFDGPDTGCYIETPTGTKITIADLKANYTEQITADVYIEGQVIADDESGNFYKKIIIQDTTDGISINIDRTDYFSLYPRGRYIYVNLKGLYLTSFGELSGNSDGDRILNSQVDEYLKRGKCFEAEKSDTVSLLDLTSNTKFDYINKLVTIAGVEFEDALSGITYADAVNQATVNLNLTDCSNTILVRNSGYASFAGDTVPIENGYVTGVFNIFGSDNQLFIRGTDDINVTEDRCDGGGSGPTPGCFVEKDFDDNSLSSGGWTTFLESGSVNWELGTFSSYFYANISNYNGSSNDATEAWFISPSMDLSTSTTPVLNFRNAYKYNGAPLELKVSTDYNSGNPASATWTDLTASAIWSAGDFDWVDSDNVLLSSYKTANVHIAFKYTGSSSDGSNWEVDEIKICEL